MTSVNPSIVVLGVAGIGTAIGLTAAAIQMRRGAAKEHHCRFCRKTLTAPFLDLGLQPLANSYLSPDTLGPEPLHPLRVFFCPSCHLAQQLDFTGADQVFDDYFYFSSYSSSWVEHARRYVEMISQRLKLGPQSQVIEIASNDGYLLQHFVPKGIPVLGVEPSKTVAAAAIEKGIETQVKFFGVETAKSLVSAGRQADLIIGNNVLAHVPDLHDFIGGLKAALKPTGTLTIEFPHLLRLLQENQFDTVYHEHFSYLSFSVVQRMFAKHDLVLYDVEELPTHGGSIRIYGRHAAHEALAPTPRVAEMLQRENDARLDDPAVYGELAARAQRVKEELLRFLTAAKKAGKTVAGYGAPAKGNTLLNFCGITSQLLPFTVDLGVQKQGRLLPGSRIPIHPVEKIYQAKPDYILILPWNLRQEIMTQMSAVREWDCRFVTPIPEVRVFTAEGSKITDEFNSSRAIALGRHAGAGSALKVLHISYGDHQGAGGTSVATYRLHKGLDEAGIRSTIGCRIRTVRTDETFHIPRSATEMLLRKMTVPLGLNGLEGVESFELPKYPQFQKADVVHLHSIHSGYFNYMALPKITARKPAVWTIHDQWALTGHCTFSYDCERWKTGCGECPYPDNYPPIKRDNTRLEWKLKNWAYKRSDIHLVVASKWFEGMVKQSMLSRLPITRIPWGVNCQVFAPISRRASQSVLGIPAGKKIILFVAANGLQRAKGADILCSALQRFSDEERVKTMLITMGERMEGVFSGCGIETIHMGFVTNDRHKAIVYSSADALSMPTRAETFSLVTLEALACGLPVVSSSFGPLPELVRNDENGYTVPIDDIDAHANRLKTVLYDHELQRRLSTRAREIALAEYSVEVMVDQYAALYRSLIEKRRKNKK